MKCPRQGFSNGVKACVGMHHQCVSGTSTDDDRSEPERVDVAVGSVVREMFDMDPRLQPQFAEDVGTSVATFQRLIAGRVPWTVRYLVGVADALNVDPAVILIRAGLSHLAADAVSAIALDPELGPDARVALAAVIQAFRDQQAGAE